MSIVRRIGAAVAATVFAAGVSLAAAAPAEASIAPGGIYKSIVTPRNGTACNLYVNAKSVAGVTEYEGGAMCNALPLLRPWQVKVDCTNGGNYYSGTVTPTIYDWVKYAAPSFWCFWGVNSVEVIEY